MMELKAFKVTKEEVDLEEILMHTAERNKPYYYGDFERMLKTQGIEISSPNNKKDKELAKLLLRMVNEGKMEIFLEGKGETKEITITGTGGGAEHRGITFFQFIIPGD